MSKLRRRPNLPFDVPLVPTPLNSVATVAVVVSLSFCLIESPTVESVLR